MCNQRPSTSSQIFFLTVANYPKYLRELTLKLRMLAYSAFDLSADVNILDW